MRVDAILNFLKVLIPAVRSADGWHFSREKMGALVTALLGALVAFGVITPEQIDPVSLVAIWAALQAFIGAAKRDRQG